LTHSTELQLYPATAGWCKNVTQTVLSEYCDLKFLIAGNIKAGLIQNFDDMINYSLKDDEFAKLSILVDI